MANVLRCTVSAAAFEDDVAALETLRKPNSLNSGHPRLASQAQSFDSQALSYLALLRLGSDPTSSWAANAGSDDLARTQSNNELASLLALAPTGVTLSQQINNGLDTTLSALDRRDSKQLSDLRLWDITPDTEKSFGSEAVDDFQRWFDDSGSTSASGNLEGIGRSPLDSGAMSIAESDEYQPSDPAARSKRDRRTSKSTAVSPMPISEPYPTAQKALGSSIPKDSNPADGISARMIQAASVDLFGCSADEISDEQKKICIRAILRKRIKNNEAARLSRDRKRVRLDELQARFDEKEAENKALLKRTEELEKRIEELEKELKAAKRGQ